MSLDKFRFAIGEDRAAVATEWVAWAYRESFYLAGLNHGQMLKLSLHDDQNCRFAIPRSAWLEHRDGAYRPLSNRALQEWTRQPTPQRGTLHVMSAIFPTDFMRTPLRASRVGHGKPLFLFPMAPTGMCVEISFLYSLQHPSEIEEALGAKYTPLVYMSLTTGEFVSIVGRNCPFDPALVPSPDQWSGNLQVLDEAAWRDPPSNLAALLSTDPRVGDGVFRFAHVSGFKISHRGRSPSATAANVG